MAVVRSFISPGQAGGHARERVVEHELDMNRRTTKPPLRLVKLWRLISRLLPHGARAVAGAPMRSIDRELEEFWPSGSRQT